MKLKPSGMIASAINSSDHKRAQEVHQMVFDFAVKEEDQGLAERMQEHENSSPDPYHADKYHKFLTEPVLRMEGVSCCTHQKALRDPFVILKK